MVVQNEDLSGFLPLAGQVELSIASLDTHTMTDEYLSGLARTARGVSVFLLYLLVCLSAPFSVF